MERAQVTKAAIGTTKVNQNFMNNSDGVPTAVVNWPKGLD